MPKCSNSVTTPTGKFTFHTEQATRCEAIKICKENGGILAPFTNKQDIDAVKSISKWQDCPELGGASKKYMIGLDVTPTCGESKQKRVFSNGLKWNQAVHGPLYYGSANWDYQCARVFFLPFWDGPGIYNAENCKYGKTGFICLNPSGSKADSLVEGTSEGISAGVVVAGALGLAVGMVASYLWGSKKCKALAAKNKSLEEKLVQYEEPSV